MFTRSRRSNPKFYLAGIPTTLALIAAGPSQAVVVQLTNLWSINPTVPFVQGLMRQTAGPLTTSVTGNYIFGPPGIGGSAGGAESDYANYGNLAASGSASANASNGYGSLMNVGENTDTWIGAPSDYNDALTITGAGPVTVMFTEVFSGAASATPYAYAFTSDYLFINGAGGQWDPVLNSSGKLEQALTFSPGAEVTIQGDLSGGCGANLSEGSPPDPPMASCSFQGSDRLYVDVLTAGGGYTAASGTVYGTAPASGAAPEPSSWALMIAGLGLAGAALRRRTAVIA